MNEWSVPRMRLFGEISSFGVLEAFPIRGDSAPMEKEAVNEKGGPGFVDERFILWKT